MSDLHISVTHGEDGERRYRDLGLISEHVLPALEPAALVITGDVVEGKNHQGTGLQYAEEWAMYRDMLERFKRDTGASFPKYSLVSVCACPPRAPVGLRCYTMALSSA